MQNKKHKLTIAILILAAAAALYGPLANLIFAVRLARILNNLASGAAGSELHVRQSKVRRRVNNLTLDAIVYQPAGSYPTRALVMVPGISELGCYHPQLIALCRYLANEGFLILTPDIPAFRDFEIATEPIEHIVYWFQQVRTLEGSREVDRIGLSGVSFSATLSLIAAARPEIRNSVAFFLGIGPYYSLQRCFREWFASGPVTVGEGYYPTRYYAKWIVMKAALGMLPGDHDRRFLNEVLVDLLLQKKVPPADATLTAGGLRWYRLAMMRENQSDNELAQAIDSYLTPMLFRRLDPSQAAAEVRAPVFLVHGAHDDLIPPEESRDMKEHISGARCYLLISPFLTHTHPLDRRFTWSEKVQAAAEGFAFFYRLAAAVR